MSGFGWTSSKTTAPSRCSSASSASPAETTPLSVTTNGLFTPSSLRCSSSREIAPSPCIRRVGTSTVRTVSTSTLIRPPHSCFVSDLLHDCLYSLAAEGRPEPVVLQTGQIWTLYRCVNQPLLLFAVISLGCCRLSPSSEPLKARESESLFRGPIRTSRGPAVVA